MDVSENQNQSSVGMQILREKRRVDLVSLYGVTSSEEATTMRVTQDTKTCDIIQQALVKTNRGEESVNDYVVVEEVTMGWEKYECDKPRTQRLLDMNEPVLIAQSKWKGRGKFILKQRGNDPSTRAWMTTLVKEQKRREMSTSSEISSPDWDSHDDMYLVCIYNVSADQPYTILRAPHSSTVQDIITQALMKARRVDDPRNYVLLEEVVITTAQDCSSAAKARNSGRRETRILADDENVYAVQHAWQANAGKFTLMERSKALEEFSDSKKRFEKRPLPKLGFMKQFSSITRDKREKAKPGREERLPRPKTYPHNIDTATGHFAVEKTYPISSANNRSTSALTQLEPTHKGYATKHKNNEDNCVTKLQATVTKGKAKSKHKNYLLK